jgi:hypothetical protein
MLIINVPYVYQYCQNLSHVVIGVCGALNHRMYWMMQVQKIGHAIYTRALGCWGNKPAKPNFLKGIPKQGQYP